MRLLRRAHFLASSAALAVGGFARPANAQTPLPPSGVVRVGATPNDTYASAYFAQDAGFFKKAGLTTEVQTLNNGAAVSAAVAAGALDFGVSTPVQLANAFVRNVPFVMVAAGALTTPKVPAGLICVLKSGTITSAKDLEGKTVAVNALKTLSELVFDLWVSKNGGDPTKIKKVEAVFSEMGASIERGAIDAGVISEPALSSALKPGTLRVLGDPFGALAPQFLISGWFATADYARKNPDTVKRFASAIYDAGKWANDHHDDSAVILAKYTKMNVDTIKAMSRCPFAEKLLLSDIQPQLDAAAKFGIVPRVVNATDLLPK